MIQIEHLTCVREGRTVLADVSLQVAAGEVVGVLGANGAGKSSLLAAVAGDLHTSQGKIALDGQLVGRTRPRQLARLRALLPQTSVLEFDLPVPEVVAMGAYPFDELTAAQVQVLVDAALIQADAADLATRHYAGLSGGEQQRVQLARVLVQTLAACQLNSKASLLLDEPTASLDPRHQHGVLAAVQALARQQQLAVLVVLHDVNLAARWCDRLLLLRHGQAVAEGTPQAVLRCEILQAVYDMPARVLPDPDDAARVLVLFG
ncbi:iron complex transport system ATP-binding protein [Silvimonas terrae]|uniref:Iron complex transport system ATP-binding protein n=1 Tax=Silvimonas terrae TaxID=300266 RepID=A0A840RNC2_9NEIS|nr:heme ABC transporter ATP-binding protein [Silvimonas terrae]MBB5193571.1 iron complex transport system ATP-binding protein [Silvimonas terrae]